MTSKYALFGPISLWIRLGARLAQGEELGASGDGGCAAFSRGVGQMNWEKSYERCGF